MATNERQNKRKAKKNAKRRKLSKILWSVIIVVIAVLAVMKICEIDFNKIKNAFSGESSLSLVASVSDEEKFPYTLDSSDEVFISAIGNKLSILNSTSYSVINSSNAQQLLKADLRYANPVIKTSSGYSVIYDQGAYKYRLDSTEENIYENLSSNAILCADVSDSGIVVLATTSDESKSEISVYNKSLKERLNYGISYGYVTAVAIDDRGSRLAFAAVNSENAMLKTIVYTMSIDDDKPRAEFEYISSPVLDLHFCSSDLYIVGSDFVSVVSSLKKEKIVYEKGKINTIDYCYNPSDRLVLAYSEYTGSISNKISYVLSSGKIKAQADVESEIKDITASASEMTVLTDGSVISYKFSDGTEKRRMSVDDTYSSIQQMSSKIFAKRRSFIELLSD